MRACNSAVDPAVQSSQQGSPGTAAGGGFANTFLTLPRLSSSIPFHWVSSKNDEKWAKIALLCLDLVPEQELELAPDAAPRDIATSALSRWASKHCADISLMGGFQVIAGLDVESIHLYDQGDTNWADTWLIGLASNQTERWFNVRCKLEAWETLHPGMAATVVEAAERAASWTIPMFSPIAALHFGQYLYWYGMDNDEDVVAEKQAFDGESGEEEHGEEAFLPSHFKASFPEWFFRGKTLSRNALRKIADDSSTDGGHAADMRGAAATMLSIKGMLGRRNSLPTFDICFDAESAYFSCYLGGEEGDALGRVLDDFYENANAGADGYTDLFGAMTVPLDREGFRIWRRKMERWFALYSKLDRLMQYVGGF